MNRRFFTPREANELLPFVREDIVRLQQTKQEFVQTSLKLREIRVAYEQTSKEAPDDDVFPLEAKMEFLHMEARMLTDSIRLKGGELKDVDSGLVDFPALLDGEEVLLCWRLGEERIEYYHGQDDGFRGRRKIPEEAQ